MASRQLQMEAEFGGSRKSVLWRQREVITKSRGRSGSPWHQNYQSASYEIMLHGSRWHADPQPVESEDDASLASDVIIAPGAVDPHRKPYLDETFERGSLEHREIQSKASRTQPWVDHAPGEPYTFTTLEEFMGAASRKVGLGMRQGGAHLRVRRGAP